MKSQGLVKHHLQVCCRCDKEPTQWKGEENREALSQALKDQALAVADKEEAVKWVAGTVRGKVRELSNGTAHQLLTVWLWASVPILRLPPCLTACLA